MKYKFKRIISILTSLIMVFTMIPFLNVYESESYDYLSYGIDVSKFQSTINWEQVAQTHIDFAIIRAGTTKINGETYSQDSYFEKNYNGAKAAGLNVGSYFYCGAYTEAGFKQCTLDFLGSLSGKSFEFPVYIDIEQASNQQDLGKSVLTTYILSSLDLIKNAGYRAGVYANKDWFTNYIDISRIKSAGYEIWWAQYPSGSYAVDPTEYDKSSQCGMWQYSNKGSVSGISGDVDLNVSYINYSGEVTPIKPPINPSNPTNYGKYAVNTSSGLNVRSEPNTSSSVLCAAPNETTFYVEKISGDWGFTSSIEGWVGDTLSVKSGWVNLNYCKLIEPGSTTTTPPTSELVIPAISLNKDSYSVGDTINISWTPSPTNSNISHYWLVIDGPGEWYPYSGTMNLETSYSFVATQPGDYVITTYATPKGSLEGEGSLIDTKTINVVAITTTTMTAATTTSTTTTITTTKRTYEADGGFSKDEIESSPVKPIISASQNVITLEEAKSVQQIDITVSGANQKYCSTQMHIYFDKRLEVVLDPLGHPDAWLGHAGEYLVTIPAEIDSSAVDYDMKGIYVKTAAEDNYGLDGIFWSLKVTLPDDAKPGDVYPIDIVYRSNEFGEDLFVNKEVDRDGKLMQAYTWTQGIYNEKYNNNFRADSEDISKCSALSNISRSVDGYIAIADVQGTITTTIATTTTTTETTTTTPPVTTEPIEGAGIAGDANEDGKVDLKDVILIRRCIAGGWDVELNDDNADVNDDGVVDLKDVILIRRYIAGGWDVVLK